MRTHWSYSCPRAALLIWFIVAIRPPGAAAGISHSIPQHSFSEVSFQPVRGPCGRRRVASPLSNVRTPAARHSLPWVVSLRYKTDNRHFCAGVLLRSSEIDESDVVLTAAKCILNKPLSTIKLVAGTRSLTKNGQIPIVSPTITVIGAVYNIIGSTTDGVALLRLSSKIPFNRNVQPICLPAPHWRPPMRLFLAGWGHGEGTSNPQSTVHHISVPALVRTNICRLMHGPQFDPDSMLCAGVIDHPSSLADTGSPLMGSANADQWFVIGVAIKNGAPPYLANSVFMRVERYFGWISDMLRHPEKIHANVSITER